MATAGFYRAPVPCQMTGRPDSQSALSDFGSDNDALASVARSRDKMPKVHSAYAAFGSTSCRKLRHPRRRCRPLASTARRPPAFGIGRTIRSYGEILFRILSGINRRGSYEDAYFSLDDRLGFTAGRSCQWSAGIRRCTDMQARRVRDGWSLGQSIGKGLHKG